MQDYDESFFIAKANKRASITWFVLLLIASVFYGIKVGRGQLKEAYFTGFFCCRLAVVSWRQDLTEI